MVRRIWWWLKRRRAWREAERHAHYVTSPIGLMVRCPDSWRPGDWLELVTINGRWWSYDDGVTWSKVELKPGTVKMERISSID